MVTRITARSRAGRLAGSPSSTWRGRSQSRTADPITSWNSRRLAGSGFAVRRTHCRDSVTVALHGAAQRALSVNDDLAPGERRIDPLEAIWGEALRDAPHRRGGERNEIGIRAHEADMTPVGTDLQSVAGE